MLAAGKEPLLSALHDAYIGFASMSAPTAAKPTDTIVLQLQTSAQVQITTLMPSFHCQTSRYCKRRAL